MATDLCSTCLLQPSTSACISNARRLNTVNLRNEFTPKKQKIGGRTWKITQQAHTKPGTEEELPAGPLEFNEQRYLAGRASDPRTWMGPRCAPGRRQVHYIRERYVPGVPEDPLVPIAHARTGGDHHRLARGGATSHLERHGRTSEIDALTFPGRVRRFDEALYDTYADGIAVLHLGRIVYERYFGALEAHLQHTCYSITKSYAGTLAAAFVDEGVLDDTKPIPYHLPELRRTAFEDATLRELMDMQTGLDYSEDCADRCASVGAYVRACGSRPRPAGYGGPQTLCEYLRTVRKEGPHGESFAYRIINTEVMNVARVTGRSCVQLLHERLWAPLGCEEYGYVVVDAAGMPLAGCGLSLTMRDMARFGELMRCEGTWRGKQLIPASVVHDVQLYNDPSKLPSNLTYRNQWWVSRHELRGFYAAGIYGQHLYVLPEAETVIARFASHPVVSGAANKPITSHRWRRLSACCASSGPHTQSSPTLHKEYGARCASPSRHPKKPPSCGRRRSNEEETNANQLDEVME